MKIKQVHLGHLFQKTCAYLANFSLFLNIFLPYLVTRPVFAQDATPEPTPIVENTPTPTVTPTEEPAITPTNAPVITPTIEPTAEPIATPTEEPVITTTETPVLTPTTIPTITDTPAENNNQSSDNSSSNSSEPTAPATTETPTVTATPTILPQVLGATADRGVIETKVVENNSCRTDLLNPQITSDKADYSPSEIAIISGSGFAVNTEYILVVTAEGQPSQTYNIVSDSTGNFTYSYRLYDAYIPNYKIELTSLTGLTLATTKFTDSTELCSNDVNGANDVSVQKDLTLMCYNPDVSSGSVNTRWNWDDISWSGNNTGDACNLFDTDNDGNINYAICVTIGENPAIIQSYTRYSCGNDKPDRCTSPNTILPKSNDTNCTVSTVTNDPFPSGSFHPQDTQGSCSISLSDVGGISAKLVDVCSYPSQQPNSDPSDCIIGTSGPTGKLEVKKILNPSNDPGLFNLLIDGSVDVTNVGNSGTTGERSLPVGTYTVGESAGDDTSLSNYSSSIECRSNNGSGSIVASATNSGPLSVSVTNNSDIVCTITNTRNARCGDGKIDSGERCDDGINNGIACTPPYGTNGAPASCSYCNSDCHTVELTDGYCGDGVLQNANEECDGTEGVTSGYSCSTTCTLTRNTGTITIDKITNPSGDATDFNFNILSTDNGVNENIILKDTDTPFNKTYNTGIYVIEEKNLPTGWKLTNLVCDSSATIDINAHTAQFNLDKSENIKCTFTNTKDATLTLVKTVTNDNGGSAQPDDFKLTVDGTQVISGDKNTYTANIPYAINETQLSGYTFTSITGNAKCPKDLGGTVTLAPGDDITCTITNDDIAPSLHLIKTITNNNGGTAAATDWTLTATGAKVSPTNLSGVTPVNSGTNFKADTYSLDESGPVGYTAGNWNCIGGTMPDATHITLSLGQSATCTINNDDIAPSLTLIKEVVNDNGGTATPTNWLLTATGPTIISGAGGIASGPSFAAGTYSLSEPAGPSGYSSSSWTCVKNDNDPISTDTITLALGDTATCTVTNDDIPAHLIVIKHVINDNGGSKDAMDFSTTITGVATSNPTAAGVESGVDNLLTSVGTYSVDEGAHIGYDKNLSVGCSGIIALGETKTCTITNDDIAPSLTVIKTVINNNSGTSSIDDFAIKLNNDALSFTETSPGVFTANPTVKSNILYTLTEADLPGYAEGAWICTESNDPTHAISHPFTLSEGQNVTCTVTNNDIYGKINVTKFNDLDGDGIMNNNDVGLSGWTINLSGESGVSDINGQLTFNQLIPDTYYLSEVPQAGWTQTSIYCDQEEILIGAPATIFSKIVKSVNAQVAGYPVRVDESQSVNCYIGNRLLPPTATISKSNDASGDLAPGDSVNFKIKVIISGNDIDNFQVTDLMSDGFTYQSGSYSVLKNGNPYTITEPIYHSPGLWDLGNLKVGDTVEMTYTANISNDQDPGIYTDLAYGYGQATYGSHEGVLAMADTIGYVDENFVGTEVPVVVSTQNSISAGVEKEIEGEVLGASTELPSTGANTIWLVICVVMFLIGLFLIRKPPFKFISILLIILLSFFTPKIQAIDTLSVRLEQPKSPTNLNDLKLTFVALEINGINPISVKCYKKTPSDGGYSQFGSNISLSAPGNTAQCQADSSILSSEGTYNFYVTANGEQSNIVSLDYKTSGPGTPSDYHKEWLNDGCDYKIHFKTADDGGKTAKVELYRSEETSFTLDDNSKVASINISSNQESSITNSVPNCSKGYYYVLRAFDNAGNGSGTIGDSVTVTKTSTTITTTTTTGAIPITNATISPEEENPLLTGTPTLEENITNGEEGTVLGTTDTNKSFIQKYWLPLLLGLIGLLAIIRYVLSKKKRALR